MKISRSLPPLKILYKDEIILRPIAGTDYSLLLDAVRESKAALHRFMHWSHEEMSEEAEAKLLLQFQSKYLAGEEFHFLGQKKDGEFLFCAGIVPHGRLNPTALEIGYWVSSKWQGKGYGTLALQILTIVSFELFESDLVSVFSSEDNIGSLKVLEKCGYKKNGLIRNFIGQPTKEMLEKGYGKNRNGLMFSLIPTDLPALEWYPKILSSLKWVDISGESQTPGKSLFLS